MSTAAILAIIQLVTALAPPTVQLVNTLVAEAQNSGMPEGDLLARIAAIQASLKPMDMKV